MNDIFYNEDVIILNKSFKYLKYIIFLILVIIIFIIESIFIKFPIVSKYKAVVTNDYYIKAYIKKSDISYIEKMEIENISEYKIMSINFIPNNNLYEIGIKTKINYQINTIINIKINKKNTTLFKKTKEFILQSIKYN